MSESFQEFCKRILPAVKEAAESGVFVFPSGIFGSIGVNGDCVCLWANSSVLSKREPEVTPLPITPEMWEEVNPKCNYAFMSKRGLVLFTESEPKWGCKNGDFECDWDYQGYAHLYRIIINLDGVIPELSLTKRPEQAKAKDYPEPPEFTVNVDRLKTAAEMLKELDEQRELDKKSELDECKSQATHYMQANGGKLLFRKVEGEWQLLHEPSKLWTSAFIVNHSSLIEIK